MESWNLRLNVVDKPDEPFILHVSRHKSHKNGGHKLDLDLIATDGEKAFRGEVREKKIHKLRDDEYRGSPEEWAEYLSYAFVSPADANLSTDQKDRLDIACRLRKASLLIALQISVEGIHSKLGLIELRELTTDEAFATVDPFQYAVEVIKQRDRLQEEAAASKHQIEASEESIMALQAHLQDLLKAKEEHETQILSKFVLLINEKKLKIRTQQRQIAEKSTLAKSSKPASTKNLNRKRKAEESEVGDDAESSDAFDTTQIHRKDEDRHVESDQAQSTELDTESESGEPSTSLNHAKEIDGRSLQLLQPTSSPRDFTSSSKMKTRSSSPPVSNDVEMQDEASGDDETASEDDEL